MRKSGTVKWFNQAKGFGFILPDGGGPDVFVHVSALTQAGISSLAEGQRLSFDLAQDRGKTMASDLQLDGPPPPQQPRSGGFGDRAERGDRGGFRHDGGGMRGPRGGFGDRGGFGGRDRDRGGDRGERGGGERSAGPAAGPRPHAGIFDALNMVVMRVRDLNSARGWYERVLEFRATDEPSTGETVVLDLGRGPNLCLWQLGADETLASTQMATAFPNFRTNDVDGARGRLEGLGVSVTPMKESGGVKWFSFYDPDGNRIDVVQNRPRGY